MKKMKMKTRIKKWNNKIVKMNKKNNIIIIRRIKKL